MLYEVVLTTKYASSLMINRWNYLSTTIPALTSGSFALLDAMGWTVTPPTTEFPADSFAALIRGLLSTSLRFVSVSAKAIYDLTDFYEIPWTQTITGGSAGEGTAPFVAYGYRTSRVRADISRATKRFAGVVEANIGDGGIFTGGTVTNMGLVADKMGESLVYADSDPDITYQPCVVGKQRYNPSTGLPDPEGTAYRYYPDEEDQLAKLALGITWQPYIEARSQTSRQYGRGM